MPIFTGMLVHFLADYVKHRLAAKSRHGTHSPFVYKLVDEVIYDFSPKKVYAEIENLRKKLLHDGRMIEKLDPRFTGKQLQNPKLTRLSKSSRLDQLLFRIAENHLGSQVIDIGTNLGLSTAYLFKAKPGANLVSLESQADIAALAYENFKALTLTNVELQVGELGELLAKELDQRSIIDIVYIQVNPREQDVLNYFYQCLEKCHERSLIIIKNIYWSEGMKKAWQEIKNCPRVTVTIDLFWIGLVYFKKDQVKEHFKIKF